MVQPSPALCPGGSRSLRGAVGGDEGQVRRLPMRPKGTYAVGYSVEAIRLQNARRRHGLLLV